MIIFEQPQLLILEVGKLYQVESFSKLLYYYELDGCEFDKYPKSTSIYNNSPLKPTVMFIGWDWEARQNYSSFRDVISFRKFLYLNKFVFFPTGYEFIKVH